MNGTALAARSAAAPAVPVVRTARRLAALLAVIAAGVVLAVALMLVRLVSRDRHAAWLAAASARWFRAAARALDLAIEVRGTPARGPLLLAANHVSWLDVVALGTVIGADFVAKAEVARWPLLGWLAAQGGTLFVTRAERHSVGEVSDLMTWRLKRGARLAFFPEGTTTDGRGLRSFRSRLFLPAVHLRCPVQPVGIVYRRLGGDPAPEAPFVGEDAFVPHLWRLLRSPVVDCELRFAPALVVGVGEDRRGLAARVERAVARALAGHADTGPACHRTVTKPA